MERRTRRLIKVSFNFAMKKNYAYVDGSYNPYKNLAGYGGFVVDQNGKEHIIQGIVDDEGLTKLRNVGGEMAGVVYAIELAVKLGMPFINIFYDYLGLEMWATGKWKTKNKWTKRYAEFFKSISTFKIYWHKVAAHTGNKGNERADKLAKEAVGLK